MLDKAEGTTAEILANGNAKSLRLLGLRTLPDSSAEALSTFSGELVLALDKFPDSAAAILRSHPSFVEEDEDDEDEDDED